MNTGETQLEDKDNGSVDPWDLIYLFRNNLGKIALCVLLALGAVAFYLRGARPEYVSTALLEVAPDSREDPRAMEDLEASDTLKTFQLKIDNQSVLLGVIQANHLETDPDFVSAPRRHGLEFAWLQKALGTVQPAPPSQTELVKRLADHLDISIVRGSRVIQIQASAYNPQKAQRLAQSVIDEFFKQSWDARHQESTGDQDRLLAEAKKIGDDFRASQETLQAYRLSHNAVSLEERQDVVVERMRDLNQHAAEAENIRLNLAAERTQVLKYADTDPEQLLAIGQIADDLEIVEMRKEVALQEAQVATLAKRYGPLHPTMVQARSHLDDLRASLIAGIRKGSERILLSYDAADARKKALDAALAEQENAALELDRIAIPYHALEREVEANGAAFQKVLSEIKETDVSRGILASGSVEGTNIRVLQRPLAPIRPSHPRPRLLLAVSAAFGLFLGCGSALVSRALDNTVSSVDDAESFLGVPVLATILRSTTRKLSRRPLVVRQPASLQAEAFRSLRTLLSLLPPTDEGRRCTLLTSAVPGEGKSFCAVNFASVLAQQGLRTLLIDGDLRRPSLRRLLAGGGPNPGLSECLAHPDRMASAVVTTEVPNLACLGDLTHVPGGAELLGRGGMREILARALASFDRVVVDTAPLIAVSDALHLARDVPTVCLVVNARKTPRRLARRALKLLHSVGGQTATGVILNKVGRRPSAGHRYYYYSSE